MGNDIVSSKNDFDKLMNEYSGYAVRYNKIKSNEPINLNSIVTTAPEGETENSLSEKYIKEANSIIPNLDEKDQTKYKKMIDDSKNSNDKLGSMNLTFKEILQKFEEMVSSEEKAKGDTAPAAAESLPNTPQNWETLFNELKEKYSKFAKQHNKLINEYGGETIKKFFETFTKGRDTIDNYNWDLWANYALPLNDAKGDKFRVLENICLSYLKKECTSQKEYQKSMDGAIVSQDLAAVKTQFEFVIDYIIQIQVWLDKAVPKEINQWKNDNIKNTQAPDAQVKSEQQPQEEKLSRPTYIEDLERLKATYDNFAKQHNQFIKSYGKDKVIEILNKNKYKNSTKLVLNEEAWTKEAALLENDWNKINSETEQSKLSASDSEAKKLNLLIDKFNLYLSEDYKEANNAYSIMASGSPEDKCYAIDDIFEFFMRVQNTLAYEAETTPVAPVSTNTPQKKSVNTTPVTNFRGPNALPLGSTSYTPPGSNANIKSPEGNKFEAIEKSKEGIASVTEKYEEFKEKHNNFIKNNSLNKADIIQKALKSTDIGDGWFNIDNIPLSVNTDGLRTLEDCEKAWYDTLPKLNSFLPKSISNKYEKAFKAISEEFNESGQLIGKIQALDKYLILSRKILRYMKNVQERLLEQNGNSSESKNKSKNKSDLDVYVSVEKDYNGEIDINKLKKDDSKKHSDIEKCFQEALKRFINPGDKKVVKEVTVSTVPGCFEDIGGEFYKSLQSVLQNESKLISCSGGGEKLDVKERKKRAAMGVLFISMAYLETSEDVVAACDGLKKGGLRAKESDKNADEFIKKGSKVRKVIKNAAVGKVKGKKLIQLVKSKAGKEFEYFIAEQKEKTIMSGFKTPSKLKRKIKKFLGLGKKNK